MNNKIQKLEDPLHEKVLPLFANKLKINHHSATQWSKCDGAWIYEYLLLTQEQRRTLLKGNAQMKAGVAVNNVLQNYYSDFIWKFGPQGKLTPTKNELKKDKQVLIHEQLEEFKNYEPHDEKDQQKKEKYLDEISNVIANGFTAMDKLIKLGFAVVSEEQISVDQAFSGLLLPIVGRTDFRFHSADSFPASHGDLSASGIVELKTIWSKAGKIKKDGERGFINAKLPTKPSLNHLVQCAMYSSHYNYQIPIYLVYLTKDGYLIFDSSNCAELTQEGLQKNFKILCNTFRRREKILGQFEDQDKDTIIKSAISLVDPNFDHPFAWNNLPDDLLKHAKELWNYE